MSIRLILAYVSLLVLITVANGRHKKPCQCDVPEVTNKWGPYLQQVTAPFDHGEEPTWDDRNQLLYFVDQYNGFMNSFNPETTEINGINLGSDVTVTPVIPTQVPGQFAVGINKSLALVQWNGRNDSIPLVTILTTVDQDKVGNRFNDGKADRLGRLWWGTCGYQYPNGDVLPFQATLYKITQQDIASPTPEIRPISIGNGLAWSKNNRKFYYIDSSTRQVAAYDFDLQKGEISNKQIAFDLANYPQFGGIPDGMTIDEDDQLYVALHGGGAVLKVNPETGELVQYYSIPADFVTSAYFGGKNLDILFVTTSRHGLTADQLSTQPGAGSIFALTGLGTRGRKAYYADLNV